MSISLFNFLSFYGKSGATLQDSLDLTKLANYTIGTTGPLTALAGGGQAGATQLNPGFNEIDTVATNGDSVQLPFAIPGTICWVNNDGASTLDIYANASPNVNNASALDQMISTNTTAKTAAGSALTLATGHCGIFVCTTIGLFKLIIAS